MDEFLLRKYTLQNNLLFYKEEQEKINQKLKTDQEIKDLEEKI